MNKTENRNKERKIIGYIRVSTEKQELDRQKISIKDYCKKNNVKGNIIWIEETISTRKTERKIHNLSQELNKGDLIIVDELSRLGRSMFDVFGILKTFQEKKIDVIVINPLINIYADEKKRTLETSYMLSALMVAAELERKMISDRTKSGLVKVKQDGIKKLGRPANSSKLKNKETESKIKFYLEKGLNITAISKLLDVSRNCVYNYLRISKIDYKKKEKKDESNV